MSVLHYGKRVAALVALAIAASACSPALNWREVPLEGLVVLLPCKPDHAQRAVPLGTQTVMLQMAGCEAAGALYAVSHVRVADIGQLESVKTAWRQATLATLQAGAEPQIQTLSLAKPLAGQARAQATVVSGTADTALRLEKLEGKRADGSAVQAQLVWLTKGQDIYHAAVYGAKLDKEMTELLFSELRLQ